MADAAGTRGHGGRAGGRHRVRGQAVTPETLDFIHPHKTAALIRASLRVGAGWPAPRPRRLPALSGGGRALGLAFQIVDDMLDVEGSPAELGKTAGKDQAQQKATYPAVHGLDRLAGARAQRSIAEAVGALAAARPAPPSPIRALGRFIVERKA